MGASSSKNSSNQDLSVQELERRLETMFRSPSYQRNSNGGAGQHLPQHYQQAQFEEQYDILEFVPPPPYSPFSPSNSRSRLSLNDQF